MGYDERTKDFRRMSVIVKPMMPDGHMSEDTIEVKTFLEDLKSNRNSPLDVRDRKQSRIIEENEDDSSSDTQ